MYVHRQIPCGSPVFVNVPNKGINDMKHLPTLLGAAGLLAAPAVAAVEISGNVQLTSDYSFRGWSQTMRDPAIQGGFDLGFEGGFYVGTWGSNVNFGASDDGKVASMEWDLYAGWGGDIAEGVGLDVSLIHFEYPGDRGNLNYQEVAASLAFGDFTVGINYSPEYLAVSDVSFLYPYVDYSYGITDDMSLDLHLGFNMADSPGKDFFGDDDGYLDYSISISFPVASASLSIGLFGTDNEDNCGRDCELRPIVSLSKSL